MVEIPDRLPRRPAGRIEFRSLSRKLRMAEQQIWRTIGNCDGDRSCRCGVAGQRQCVKLGSSTGRGHNDIEGLSRSDTIVESRVRSTKITMIGTAQA